MIGHRIGPYLVESKVGEGGMGEVYRAKDTRLDRTVAIKVLPAALADNPAFKARFAREAQSISRLDHPHICALYDVGDTDGTAYLVMQYLEGETLAARLARGGLPLDETLQIAGEIAAALAHAHQHGIVHRDLKPGNVMLTKSGARLLDFGLAKPMAIAGEDDATRAISTVTTSGAIVGTIQYMAPEQIEGREADARSDLFAFGALLYEMLTGRRAFTASTQAGIMSAILRDTPSAPSSLVAGLPAALDHIVSRCLAKSPDERWASAHDLVIELEWIRSGAASAAPVARTSPGRWKERLAWMAVALVVSVVTAGLSSRWRPSTQATTSPVRFTLPPPPGLVWVWYNLPLVSPDGRWVASIAAPTASGQTDASVWLRRLDEVSLRPVPGLSTFTFNSWSADSKYLYFTEGTTLKRLRVDGGSIEAICTIPAAPYLSGTTINPEGVMLLGFDAWPIHRAPVGGGAAEPILTLDAAHGEAGQGQPTFLPDGTHYLFTSFRKPPLKPRIMITTLGSPERTELIPGAHNPVYLAPGLLLFTREHHVMAQRFDPVRRTFDGAAVAIESMFAPDVPSVSAGGTLVYRGRADGRRVRTWGDIYANNTRLSWFDRAGHELETVTPLGAYRNPRLSPDQRLVVVEKFDDNNEGDIWVFDAMRHVGTPFATDPGADANAAWSPDGSRIAWSRDSGGDRIAVVVRRADGADEPTIAPTEEGSRAHGKRGPFLSDWSPDGRYLAITRLGGETHGAMIEISAMNGAPAVRWPQATAEEYDARFSPDGRLVAYLGTDTGTRDVYVRSFPPGPAKVRVSINGGIDPQWRGDSRELYYLTLDHTLVSVTVQSTGGRIDVGQPVPLFKAPVPDPLWLRNSYQVSRDGKRFLLEVLDKAVPPPSPDVMVVLNWVQSTYSQLAK
jgi:eukaryotic-like serine/threonine-protein kinase